MVFECSIKDGKTRMDPRLKFIFFTGSKIRSRSHFGGDIYIYNVSNTTTEWRTQMVGYKHRKVEILKETLIYWISKDFSKSLNSRS